MDHDAQPLAGSPAPGNFLLRAVWWMGLIVGIPIALVSTHLMAERFFPRAATELAWLIGISLIGGQILTIHVVRDALEVKLGSMLAIGSNMRGVDKAKLARPIASVVSFGVSLIMGLLIFDYYAHYNKSQFADGQTPAQIIAASVASPPLASGPVAALADTDASPASAAQPGTVLARPFLVRAGEALGTFGDFFGGVVNPLLTFGTLVALAITLLLQRTQLTLAETSAAEAAVQIRRQAFDTTFFNMLNLHNSTVKDLRFDSSTVRIPVWKGDPYDANWQLTQAQIPDPVAGRKFFNYSQTPTDYPPFGVLGTAEGRQVFNLVLEVMRNVDGKWLGTESGAYYAIQTRHNYVLGHYFRTLYQVLELVDEEYKKDFIAAKRYSSILRAQLSAHELLVLFYNCCYDLVDDGKFRHLIIKYAMLEHLPLNRYGSSLFASGFPFELGRHVHQYFERAEDGNFTGPGAFGTNRDAADYCKLMQAVWSGQSEVMNLA